LRAFGEQPVSSPARRRAQANSKLEAAYHKAHRAIEDVIKLLAA
jgi:hypothetical protein